MRDPFAVDGPQRGDHLSEDVPGGLLWELLGQVYHAEQLTVLLDFHDVVKDALEFAIGTAVYPSHIEVDYLNHVSMSGLRGHADLIEKNLDHSMFLRAVPGGLVDLVIHDLYGHALVCRQIDAQLHSESGGGYCENRPTPSLNKTRYFSSMVGHS